MCTDGVNDKNKLTALLNNNKQKVRYIHYRRNKVCSIVSKTNTYYYLHVIYYRMCYFQLACLLDCLFHVQQVTGGMATNTTVYRFMMLEIFVLRIHLFSRIWSTILRQLQSHPACFCTKLKIFKSSDDRYRLTSVISSNFSLKVPDYLS